MRKTLLVILLIQVIILVIVPCVPQLSYSQTKEQFEMKLQEMYAKIEKLSEKKDDSKAGYKSLQKANLELSNYLKKVLPTMKLPFNEVIAVPLDITEWLEDGKQIVSKRSKIVVTSSIDNKLRIWSWNSLDGGSMIHFKNVIECQTERGLRVIDPEIGYSKARHGGQQYDTIFTLKTDSVTYYLCRGLWVGDGRTAGNKIYAMSIRGNNLNMCENIFFNDSLSPYIYSFKDSKYVCYMDVSEYDCPIPDSKVGDDGKTIYAQGIKGKDKESGICELGDWWEVYKFDGRVFRYKGREKKQ